MEFSEYLLLKIEHPDFVEPNRSNLVLKINDDDSAKLPENTAYDFRPTEDGQSLADYADFKIPVKALRGSKPSTQSDSHSLHLNGINNGFYIKSHPEINSSGPYKAKTKLIYFRTSDDILRRQFIYKQGNLKRGINVYLENRQLHVGAYNKTDDDGGIKTPWGPSFHSSGIVKDTEYLLILTIDSISGEFRSWLNSIELGPAMNTGPLFSDSSGVSIGAAVGSTLIRHDEIVNNRSYFKGRIRRIIGFNRLLKEAVITTTFRDFEKAQGLGNKLSIKNNFFKLSEGPSTTRELTFILKKPLNREIPLDIKISGTATPSVDYQLIGEPVIPSYATKHTIKFKAIPDDRIEYPETAKLTIRNDVGIPVEQSLHIQINDPDLLNTEAKIIDWVELSDKASSHTAIKGRFKQEKPDKKVFASLENSYRINLAPQYRQKSIALKIKTGDNIDDRQIIYKQGNRYAGINIFINEGKFFFLTYNLKNTNRIKSWESIILTIKLSPTKITTCFPHKPEKEYFKSLHQ